MIVESIRGERTMRKSRFSESQIIGIIKEHEAGARVEDLWDQRDDAL